MNLLYRPFWGPYLMPSFTWMCAGASENEVFLTFDDGPHPDITPWVIHELEQREMKATFFCIGDNVKKYPNIFQLLNDSGMTVGNHGMHHLNGWKTSCPSYLKDIHLAADYLGNNKLFRPPYGKLTPCQSVSLRKDYEIIMWSMVTGDWKTQLDCDEVLKNLKKHTVSGFIPVFHDSEKAWKNLRQLLPAYLDFLKENNFISKGL